MAYWKRCYRKLDGKRRLVKVHSGKRGTGRVRVIGNRNSTDKGASRRNRKRRVRGYSNHSDRTGKNYRR